jgi:hypothetical protein
VRGVERRHGGGEDDATQVSHEAKFLTTEVIVSSNRFAPTEFRRGTATRCGSRIARISDIGMNFTAPEWGIAGADP